MVTLSRTNSPWLKTPPPCPHFQDSHGRPSAQPPCSVRFCNVNDAPALTSSRRKKGTPAAVLLSMTAPLPTMVRLSPAATCGSPVAPLTVLFTAESVKFVPAASVIESGSGVRLAALMSAISSATVAAAKLAGTHRCSSPSTVRRVDARRRRADLCSEKHRQRSVSRGNRMVLLLLGAGPRYNKKAIAPMRAD